MDPAERREQAAQEAAEWMLRLSSSEMGRIQRLEYVAWLRESPLHVAAMLRVASAHRQLTEFEQWDEIPRASPEALVAEIRLLPTGTLGAGIPWGPGEAEAQPRGGPVRALAYLHAHVRSGLLWAGGSLVAVIVIVGLILLHLGAFVPRTITAEAGQGRDVRLPDGSQVHLSPRSRLEVHFTAHERDVVLAEGRALFRVAKNPSWPFVVTSGRARVRAVGTVFGVEHEGASIIVTVEEGRVAVAESAGLSPKSPKGGVSGMYVWLRSQIMEISLGANQQVVVPVGGPIGDIRMVDSHRALAWAEGRLIFDNVPVAKVVQRFNEFNRVQLKVTDTALAARPVTAVFDATDPQALIIFLEATADVRVTRTTPDQIVIALEGPR